MTHALKPLSTGQEGIKMPEINENDSAKPDIGTVAKVAEGTVEEAVKQPLQGEDAHTVASKDAESIGEIRSTFEQTEEPIDSKMGREIDEEDNLIGIDQARSRADRRIEKAHKTRKRNMFLVPLIALASLVGVYKASERQEAVDKAKDAEWSKTADGIKKNVSDHNLSEAVEKGNVTGGEEATQYVSGDQKFEVDNNPKQ